jgi:hypothetical protein
MSDFSKLLKIVSETTSGAVASVAQPLTTEAQKRDDESSASNIDVVEYGNWENSALVTGDKLKRERKKAAKVVKSIYGEGSEQKRKSILESLQEVSSDDFNIGDPVEITGPVQFKGSTGEVVDVRNGFVVVDLYNHGKRSFHASDVSYNDYADSDEEEAHHYDREKDARDREGMAEGSLNEGQYEMMLRNGQVKKFVAKDDADAKRIAAGHGAKSVIKLRGGVPAGKIAEQGVTEGVAETLPLDDAIKVLKHYGANSFIKSIDNLKFYKNDRPLSIDLIQNDDGTRSVSLSQLNSATRQLKGQGTSEDSAKALVTKWMGLHRRYGGYDDFDVNQMKKRVLSDFDYKEKLEQEIKSAQRKQGVAEDFRKSSQKYDFELDDIMVPYSDDTIEVGVNYTTAEDEDYNGRVEQIVDTVEVHDLATGKEITELLSERTLNWIYSQAYEQLEQAQADERDFAASDRGEQMKRDRDMGYFESNQGVTEATSMMQRWKTKVREIYGKDAKFEVKKATDRYSATRTVAYDKNGDMVGYYEHKSGRSYVIGASRVSGNMATATDDEMEKKQGVAEGSGDKVHLKTPKHGLADHPGRNTGVGLNTFAATPEQDRCPKCNSLYKNHYQKQGVAEGFLSGLEVYMDPKDGKVKKYPAKSTKPTTGLDVYMDPKDGKVKKYPVKQGVAEDEYVDDTYEKPVLLSFELYNIKTNERVYGPFKAYDLFGAAIKADDYLEAKGMNGKGLTVRRVKKQGVAEGLSDVVKGIKRTIKGKEDPKDVEHTYARVARRDTQDANKLQNQAAYDARDKSIKRWEKVNKVVNKEGVAEDSDPCWDNYKQIGMKTKNGKQVPNCVPKESVEEATTKPAKVEAYGYKYNNRDQRIVWRKIFPSIDAMNKWAEKTNATVIGTREV